MVRIRPKPHATKIAMEPARLGDAATDSIASLQLQLVEIRELLVDLLQAQGNERAGSRLSPRILSDEKPITLEEAAKQIWGKSLDKNAESLLLHADILKGWATRGINGIVLETRVVRNRWKTSREAVTRFKRGIHASRTVL